MFIIYCNPTSFFLNLLHALSYKKVKSACKLLQARVIKNPKGDTKKGKANKFKNYNQINYLSI